MSNSGAKRLNNFSRELRKSVILTNVLYTYRQNTTVLLDVVYLLVLRYMFRPMYDSRVLTVRIQHIS
jgi:hypothetical protein